MSKSLDLCRATVAFQLPTPDSSQPLIMAKDSASNHDGELIKAWAALSTFLPSRGPDCDYWWQLTGMHLASLMEAAGYAIERQYEALLFHYHWMVSLRAQVPIIF